MDIVNIDAVGSNLADATCRVGGTSPKLSSSTSMLSKYFQGAFWPFFISTCTSNKKGTEAAARAQVQQGVVCLRTYLAVRATLRTQHSPLPAQMSSWVELGYLQSCLTAALSFHAPLLGRYKWLLKTPVTLP